MDLKDKLDKKKNNQIDNNLNKTLSTSLPSVLNNENGMNESDSDTSTSSSSEDYESVSDNSDDQSLEQLGSEDEEQEDEKDYYKGGYHIVCIGDYYNNKYYIIRKLGWGNFSTVWMAWDDLNKIYVAIKIAKSKASCLEGAKEEIELLNDIHKKDVNNPYRQRIVNILDNFDIVGKNGIHKAIVFELLGNNLLKLIIKSQYTGIKLNIIKTISKQTLEGLSYLHKCKVVHTDLKPENILVCMTQKEIKSKLETILSYINNESTVPFHLISNILKNNTLKISKRHTKLKEIIENELKKINDEDESLSCKIADLGNSCYLGLPWSNLIQTRQYRSLEVIMKGNYDCSADIWSLACIIFELATGDYLFDPSTSKDFTKNEEHIAKMIELLGQIPTYLIQNTKNFNKYFDKEGKLKNIIIEKQWSISEVLILKYKWNETDAKELSEFLTPMLDYDVKKRATADKCLEHNWLK